MEYSCEYIASLSLKELRELSTGFCEKCNRFHYIVPYFDPPKPKVKEEKPPLDFAGTYRARIKQLYEYEYYKYKERWGTGEQW